MEVSIILMGIQGLLLFSLVALASDPIHDFCVPDSNSQASANGIPSCKDPKEVRPEDFFYAGLHLAGEITSALGTKVTPVTSTQVPGLNSLKISIARIDFAPWGINPPHTHPRATEVLLVLEGTLEVGFVTARPDNRHMNKTLQRGDVFVFPLGLIHYQRNAGSTPASAVAAFSSQSPGVVAIAEAIFGSEPDIPSNLLVKAFQVDNSIIRFMKSKF